MLTKERAAMIAARRNAAFERNVAGRPVIARLHNYLDVSSMEAHGQGETVSLGKLEQTARY